MTSKLQPLLDAAAKATPGEWYWFDDAMHSTVLVMATKEREESYGERHDHYEFLSEPIIETDGGYYGPNEADRAFIAAARNAIPALRSLLESHARMEEWILEAEHHKDCLLFGVVTETDHNNCTCGLSALRQALKEQQEGV